MLLSINTNTEAGKAALEFVHVFLYLKEDDTFECDIEGAAKSSGLGDVNHINLNFLPFPEFQCEPYTLKNILDPKNERNLIYPSFEVSDSAERITIESYPEVAVKIFNAGLDKVEIDEPPYRRIRLTFDEPLVNSFSYFFRISTKGRFGDTCFEKIGDEYALDLRVFPAASIVLKNYSQEDRDEIIKKLSEIKEFHFWVVAPENCSFVNPPHKPDDRGAKEAIMFREIDIHRGRFCHYVSYERKK